MFLIINQSTRAELELVIHIKMDLALNNLQRLICHKKPKQPTGFIARDMGASEFLIRQVMHEDIRYFSYKMRKPIFITICEEEEERPCCNVQQTQISSLNEHALIFLR